MWLDDYTDDPIVQRQQEERKERARNQFMFVRHLDLENEWAEIESSAGNGQFYNVSSSGCTCMDYFKRGMPCKHMYKLKYEVEKAKQAANAPAAHADKSKTAALLLCIFLGPLGIHYFYVGRIRMGVLYLFTVGLFCFGWLYDIFRIAMGKFCDSDGVILE